MELVKYIRPMSDLELETFAKACDSTPGQLKQVAYGRRASADLAIRIDIASWGAVTCEDIRSDINWAYLRGNEAQNQAA